MTESLNTIYEQCQELTPISIPIEVIYSNADFNCRGDFAVSEVMSLANDIREKGLLQPIIVMPYDEDGYEFMVIAGHRRFAAFQYLNMLRIPAVVKTGLTKVQALAINLIENIQRQDLNIVQEANGLQHLVDAGLNQSQISDYIGKSTGWVNTRMNLLKMPDFVKHEAIQGTINQSHINYMAKYAPLADQMREFIAKIRRANALGEKVELEPKKKDKESNKDVKKVRTAEELYRIQTHIRETIGNCLATRVIAFATGNITLGEFYDCMVEECNNRGIKYEIPN